MKFFIPLFILTLFTFQLKGQEFFFKQINVDAGLSHNLVFCTMQDEYGFIWFGTKDGLNRYDGYKMKKFRNLPGDKTSLGNNDVRALLCRSKNEIWVATRKGLFIFDVLKEQFREIERFKNSFVSSILKEGKSVWVISNHDLYRISPNDTTKFQLPEGTISSICKLDNGHIW
ncbi:MAG TPA: two-component regulator propeller domain-containing protein, partial [Niabella sp.]|nr:two-component regulator propeller domain-containing protein [Niabella sp.]